MSISQPDIKLLWGRAASRCSICRAELTQDGKSTSQSFPVGEQAHIVAEQTNGTRGESILAIEERNSYHNLILLCPTHHTIIDKDEEDFPIEKLYVIKSRHELWVRDTLEKELEYTSREIRPVSHLLWLVGEILPILFWLNRSVPANKAENFLYDLQGLWLRGHAIFGIDSRLAFGMDLLLRPISSTHFLMRSGQGYTQSKLWGANCQFSRYFTDRGFEWDDFKSAPETEIILHYLERNAKKLEESSRLLDRDEFDIVKLILFTVSYYKTVQREHGYSDISEGFVWQVHAVIEAFLERELKYKLPAAFDDEENEIFMGYLSKLLCV